MRPHELDLGVIFVAGAENHTFREDSSKLPCLHVREDQDLVGKHILHSDEGLEAGDNRAKLTFAKVDLFNVEFLRLRMSLALDNLSDPNVTLGECLKFGGKVSEGIGWGLGTSSRLLLATLRSCCTSLLVGTLLLLLSLLLFLSAIFLGCCLLCFRRLFLLLSWSSGSGYSCALSSNFEMLCIEALEW